MERENNGEAEREQGETKTIVHGLASITSAQEWPVVGEWPGGAAGPKRHEAGVTIPCAGRRGSCRGSLAGWAGRRRRKGTRCPCCHSQPCCTWSGGSGEQPRNRTAGIAKMAGPGPQPATCSSRRLRQHCRHMAQPSCCACAPAVQTAAQLAHARSCSRSRWAVDGGQLLHKPRVHSNAEGRLQLRVSNSLRHRQRQASLQLQLAVHLLQLVVSTIPSRCATLTSELRCRGCGVQARR